jgi:hypothetical protein
MGVKKATALDPLIFGNLFPSEWGVLTPSKKFDYKSEADKRKEHTVQLLEAGENAGVTLEA